MGCVVVCVLVGVSLCVLVTGSEGVCISDWV